MWWSFTLTMSNTPQTDKLFLFMVTLRGNRICDMCNYNITPVRLLYNCGHVGCIIGRYSAITNILHSISVRISCFDFVYARAQTSCHPSCRIHMYKSLCQFQSETQGLTRHAPSNTNNGVCRIRYI